MTRISQKISKLITSRLILRQGEGFDLLVIYDKLKQFDLIEPDCFQRVDFRRFCLSYRFCSTLPVSTLFLTELRSAGILDS